MYMYGWFTGTVETNMALGSDYTPTQHTIVKQLYSNTTRHWEATLLQ